jgi:hypothetical protein
MMSAGDEATSGEAAGARAGRTALAAFGALALATGAELWLAVGASGDRATRVTALVGLLTAKGGVVLTWLMGARAHRRTATLTLGAMGIALGFGVILMLEAAFRARLQ